MSDIRSDFPALAQRVHGQPLVYLDSAATALKPQQVIDAVCAIYARDCGNVHRAVHETSSRATVTFEDARAAVAGFLGARAAHEVIFVRGTTEAINMVAHSWARPRLSAGDEILVTELEHHSNIVPWQLVCQATGARLSVAPITDDGTVDLGAFRERLSARTKVVAVAHVANALGTLVPIDEVVYLARREAPAAAVVVDGAQAVAHVPVDVQALDCDFYAFSAHKLYGPTGVGVLWGKEERLEAMTPYQGGGDMIESVTFEHTTYAPLPRRFEAGTPNIAGVAGLGAAIAYVQRIGFETMEARERELLGYTAASLSRVPGVRFLGAPAGKRGLLSFVMDGAHAHDIGTICDTQGVAIRTGHHCAQPTMARFGVAASARVSLGVYNRRADIDALIAALHRVRATFG